MATHFSASDLIAHRSTLVRALEELKFKRIECQDLHSRIEKLFSENLESQQNVEELQAKLKNADRRQEYLREELRVALANAGEARLDEENQRLKEGVEAAEKTIASLKKELSMNNLARHHLEITLKQAEQKAIARETSSNAVIERLRSIEGTAQKLSKQVQKSMDAQTLLHKNVEASKKMNRELARTSAHANCIINDCKRERDQLREKLLKSESNYRLLKGNGSSIEQHEVLRNEMQVLRQTKEHLESENTSKTEIIGELQTKVKEAQLALSKAHKIAELSTFDDKDVIDLEKQLEHAENKKNDLEKEMAEITSKLENVSRAKEAEIAEVKAFFDCQKAEMINEISALKSQLHEAKIMEANCRTESGKHKETYLSLKEVQARMELVQQENCSLQAEAKEKEGRYKELQSETEDLRRKITSLIEKQSQNCSEQQTQTDMEITSLALRDGAMTCTSEFSGQAGALDCAEANKDETQKRGGSALVRMKNSVEFLVGQASEHMDSVLCEGNKHETESELIRGGAEQSYGGGNMSVQRAEVANLTESEPNDITSRNDNLSRLQKSLVYHSVEHQLRCGPLDASLQSDDTAEEHVKILNERDIIVGNENASDFATSCAPIESIKRSFKVPHAEIEAQSDRGSQRNDFPGTIDLHGNVAEKERVGNKDTCLTRERIKDSQEMIDRNPLSRKHSSIVKIASSESLLRSSPVLNSVWEKVGPIASSDCEKLGIRKNTIKKRKLSSTPPMLDASQCSMIGGDPASDLICKQVPLRVPKNFSKQVFSDKPLRKSQSAGHFKPLDIMSEALASRSNADVNRPYTDLNQFSKTYGTLRDRLANSCVPGHRFASGASGSELMSGSSGTMSLGFRLAAGDGCVPASDEEDAALGTLDSDDSL